MRKLFLIFIILFLGTEGSLFSGIPQSREREIEFILQKIEQGIANGDVQEFSAYFNSRIYISLEENSTGYFSSNQAFYVLTDFFDNNIPSKFKYKHRVLTGDNPYAYGELEFVSTNKRGTFKVFISLEYIFTDWKITQITIS